MSTCRGCGQQIDWIKTDKGKNMPLDPEYINYDEAEPYTVLVTDSGHVVTVTPHQRQPNVKGRISHFATCPKGSEFRKSRD